MIRVGILMAPEHLVSLFRIPLEREAVIRTLETCI